MRHNSFLKLFLLELNIEELVVTILGQSRHTIFIQKHQSMTFTIAKLLNYFLNWFKIISNFKLSRKLTAQLYLRQPAK